MLAPEKSSVKDQPVYDSAVNVQVDDLVMLFDNGEEVPVSHPEPIQASSSNGRVTQLSAEWTRLQTRLKEVEAELAEAIKIAEKELRDGLNAIALLQEQLRRKKS